MVQRFAAFLIVLCSCVGSTTAPPSPERATSPGAPSPTAIFTRTCDSSVGGDLGLGWRRGEVEAGPVIFVGSEGYADDPPVLFAAPSARATVHKMLLMIRGARPVELSMRYPDAAFLYDEARWRNRNVVPFRLGDPRVRFEPCGGDQVWTQFNGGFLVRGAACVPIDVHVTGRDPILATLSFGAGDCR
jgi:hypothetical protein